MFSNSLKNLFISLIFFLISGKSHAAACCGGNSTIPNLITNDDRQTLSISYSRGQADTDVYANGVWRKRSEREISETYKLDSAIIVEDRFQWGLTIPVQTRQRFGLMSGSSSGLGDLSTQLGYEYLPEWDYNPYLPHGFAFLSLTAPTGKSVYESEDSASLDSRGRGFWVVGLGTALIKTWIRFDAQVILDVRRAFSRDVNTPSFQGRLEPGYGSQLTLGSGYNFKDYRLGCAISWNYEDPIRTSGSINSPGDSQRFATGSLTFSYLQSQSWTASIGYSDQTLFGDPSNAVLNKGVSLSWQKRWQR